MSAETKETVPEAPATVTLTIDGKPVTVPAGGQLGSGDMGAIFKPNLPLARTDTANIDVTYVSDPINNAASLVSVPMCGEATWRGLRVLVTQGGVPVATVKRIKL